MSSDMLREVSESLFEHLIDVFPTDTSYTRNDIEQDPMPPLLAHFLGQTLQHRLDVEVEHIRTVRSSWFDYSHPDVQHAYKAFVAALAQYSHIPSEEWRSTLKRATKLVIAHLILPTHTLVEFVFREDDGPLAAPIIYREISYFAAYPYLREAVEAFLKKRQPKEIDRTRFSSLLTQVDRHMTANYTTDQWMRMLRPLFDLMRRVPETRNQGVPIDMLSMFFGDKECYEIQGRLQVEKEVHRIATINEENLRRLLEGSVGPFEQELKASPTSKPQAEPASQPAPKAPASTSYLSAEDTPPPPAAKPASAEPKPGSEKDEEATPLWARFQKMPPQAEREEPAAPEPAASEQDPDDSVPLWMRFQKSGVKAVSETLGTEDRPARQEEPAAPESPAPEMPTMSPSVMSTPAMPRPPMDEPEEAPEEGSYNATKTDREPSPSPKEPAPYKATQPESVSAYTKQYSTNPPPSPYGSAEMPPIFKEEPVEDDATRTLSPLEALEIRVLGLGANNREMFVEHLFSGSYPEYERLLNRLSDIGTWEEASVVIAESIFKRYQINIYSPAAILFTESVEEQYREE